MLRTAQLCPSFSCGCAQSVALQFQSRSCGNLRSIHRYIESSCLRQRGPSFRIEDLLRANIQSTRSQFAREQVPGYFIIRCDHCLPAKDRRFLEVFVENMQHERTNCGKFQALSLIEVCTTTKVAVRVVCLLRSNRSLSESFYVACCDSTGTTEPVNS
jgi:hypothetical protein